MKMAKKSPSSKKAHKPKPQQLTAETKTRKENHTESVVEVQNTFGHPLSPSQTPYPIVGIGSSAGGLEALEVFFSRMPHDAGMAFVVVAHLDPNHASLLSEILQKRTKMTVQQAAHDTEALPNHIYVIPPDHILSISNGRLQLISRKPKQGVFLPIDTFFFALSRDQTSNAICIVLSGTGTDGTLGLRAVKGEAGMAMVQEALTAKYDGMPRNAAATGLADYIIPVSEMPEQLIKYVKHRNNRVQILTASNRFMETELNKIITVLRAKTDHDFSQYKINTICRRVDKRMHVHQIDEIKDYIQFLTESDHEVRILFRELLIGVTSFFRDKKAFHILRHEVLPSLLQANSTHSPFRVWVPGCSSGEEVYSIGIVIQECMEQLNLNIPVQIFGTDIDDDAVVTARNGWFPKSIAADVNPTRLKKYFIEDGNRYQIQKTIREQVVFAQQNLIRDPPFTKLNLLSCRNLLIYFSPELQKRLYPLFHYSLKPNGILFLGPSESIGKAEGFTPVMEKKWKFFRRKTTDDNMSLPVIDMTKPLIREASATVNSPIRQTTPPIGSLDTLQLLKTILHQSGLPPCVVIDNDADIVYIHGRTGRYLELAEGAFSINILEMARPGLKAPLNAAIRKTSADRRNTVIKNVQIRQAIGFITVDIAVQPIPDFQSGVHGLMLVIFNDAEPPKNESIEPPLKKSTHSKEQVRKLEEALQYTRENLQTTIEELETSNEELKSTNEELQSTNEELQSTNEELETSKEELQSLNEESSTMNAELQSRIDELSKTHDDMKNLLTATQIATVFLDMELNVQRFTPKITDIIPLTSTDDGRPIEHFATNLIDTDIKEVAAQVLTDLLTREVEVQSISKQYYRMRVIPYRTVHNVIDGVVITFDDISAFKNVESKQMLAMVMKDSYDAVILQDLGGRIIAWNRGATRLYGWTETETLDERFNIIIPTDIRPEAESIRKRAIETDVSPFVEKHVTKTGEYINVWLTMTKVLGSDGQVVAIATTGRNLKDAARLIPSP